MENLLSVKNEKYFQREYPVIYKNKVEKRDGSGYYFTNAIGTALRNN
jgi:hypothetical protein